MRNARERLDAILPAIKRGEEFKARVREAAGDVVRLSDLMAEAIAMGREAAGLETVGRDGRMTVCVEELQASYCMDAAREAYLLARGSNMPGEMG